MYIGIDSKPYWKKVPNSFSSSLAAAVTVNDYEDFQKNYIQDFSIISKKYDLPTDRLISKGFELRKKGVSPDVLIELLTELSKRVKKIFLYYAVFSVTGKQNMITIQSSGGGTEQIQVKEFIKNHLNNYFPYVCYWDLHPRKAEIGGECTFYLDSFQGRCTNAWSEIKHNTDFFVFPSGDKVNPLISISDLFNHYITYKLLKSKEKLSPEIIEKLFKEDFPKLDVQGMSISNWALYNIVPVGGQIDTKHRWKRPIFCILMETNSKIPKKVVEFSPFLNQIYNLVLKKCGSLKFFDVNQDVSFLGEDDYLVYYGKEGENMAKGLKDLGYKFKIAHIRDIMAIVL